MLVGLAEPAPGGRCATGAGRQAPLPQRHQDPRPPSSKSPAKSLVGSMMGSMMRALADHVAAAHQTLEDLAKEWDRACLVSEEEHRQLRRFFYQVRCLREACDEALDAELEAAPPEPSEAPPEPPPLPAPPREPEGREDAQEPVRETMKAMIPPLDFTGISAGRVPSHKVSFRVDCSSTRVGQHVRIVGGCDALGEWNPAKGAPARTTATAFPWWTTCGTVQLDPNAVVEYKYVICSQSGEAIQWEDGENRRLHLASMAAKAGLEGKPHVVVAEAFNVCSEAEVSGGAAGAPLCTPRQTPRDAAPLLTPTTRRHQAGRATPRSGRTASTGKSQLQAEGHGALPSQLMREDSFSQFFECKDCEHAAPSKRFLARYEMLGDGPLAAGSFGLVWRCRPLPTEEGAADRECAAKVIYKAKMLAQDPDSKIGVEEEAWLHTRLKHPNIVSLVEYFDESKAMTLVLEFCQGGDLFDAITAESDRRADGYGLDERGAATMARHVLSALAYIHGSSIVHRDVKCENVLLALPGVSPAQNTFKLCDFGFAVIDDGKGLHGQVGSPDTVAPEVVAGKTYSFPADLWSMGVVLYMALAAEPPFQASSDKKVLQRVLVGEYSLQSGPWSAVSPLATKLVASLMTVSPILRPTACQALLAEWLQFSERPPGAAARSPERPPSAALCSFERRGAPHLADVLEEGHAALT